MSNKLSYKTVSDITESVIVEKKSKFIASVFPVDNEKQALEYLASVKSKYPDATHHVYAYIIDENNIFRYTDDGEPSGTAGMPVLDVLRKEGLVDVLVVVTRYFGGTLLGTGGLVHAYGTSAKEGVLKSEIITRCLCNVVSVTVDYSLSGKIQYEIASQNYILDDTVYDENVTFFICVTPDKTEKLIDDITNITNAQAVFLITDKRYIDIK